MQHIALKAAIVLLATALQKPSMKSKAKIHQECLAKSLALWKEGEIDSLLREGRSIQKRLVKTKRTEPPNKAKIFAKLVMEGQVNSALRYLSENECGGVLPLTVDVMGQLKDKHSKTSFEKNCFSAWVSTLNIRLINPSHDAASQFKVSTKITAPLVEKIIAQDHETPADTAVKTLQQCVRRETNEALQTRLGNVRESLPQKTQRAIDLATEKGASNWLTVLPLKDMGYNLNKGEFRDAVKLRYDWEIDDKPTVCVCGDAFTIDHAMICRRGGFIIQRHNELRDLEADLLKMVCSDVEIEPVLQELTGERLPSGANTTPDARLDIHARGFWEKQRSAFFDVRVCHPNADSYKDQTPKQMYRNHENEKKRAYADRVLQVEQGTFTPLVFTSTGGMGEECKRYHSRLAELIAAKKGEDYATTVSWIRSKVSFAILRSALICLRGSRTVKRNRNIDIYDMDFQVENSRTAI